MHLPGTSPLPDHSYHRPRTVNITQLFLNSQPSKIAVVPQTRPSRHGRQRSSSRSQEKLSSWPWFPRFSKVSLLQSLSIPCEWFRAWPNPSLYLSFERGFKIFLLWLLSLLHLLLSKEFKKLQTPPPTSLVERPPRIPPPSIHSHPHQHLLLHCRHRHRQRVRLATQTQINTIRNVQITDSAR